MLFRSEDSVPPYTCLKYFVKIQGLVAVLQTASWLCQALNTGHFLAPCTLQINLSSRACCLQIFDPVFSKTIRIRHADMDGAKTSRASKAVEECVACQTDLHTFKALMRLILHVQGNWSHSCQACQTGMTNSQAPKKQLQG